MYLKRITFLLLVVVTSVSAQSSTDSLYQKLTLAQTIEERVDILNALAHTYTQLSLDRAEDFANEALELARKAGYQKGIATSYNNLGISYSIKGNYTLGMDNFIKALQIRELENDQQGVSHIYNNMARVYTYQEDYAKAIEYSKKSLEILKKEKDPKGTGSAYIAIGTIYMSEKNYDEAYNMFMQASTVFNQADIKLYDSWAQIKIAMALDAQGKHQQALQIALKTKPTLDITTNLFYLVELDLIMGNIYSNLNDSKQAAEHLHQAMQLADKSNNSDARINARLKLSELYRKFNQHDSAWHYNDQYIVLRSEVLNSEKSKQLADLEQLYQSEKKDRLLELKEQKIKSQTVIITTISILLVVITALVIIVFRYYRDKRRSLKELKKLNREIYEKHEEILTQSEELTQAYEEIKRMNESLEQQVAMRVDEIKTQNKKLIEYAYFNAHKVRGPLARILGLSMLMAEEKSLNELQEYNTRLHTSAQELDQVVREINNKLSD